MKKVFWIFCLCFVCLLSTGGKVNAQNYYYEEVIEILSESSITKATQTISGRKTAYVKNSYGTVLWYVTVEGTFSYTGTSSKCINSSVLASSKDSRWRIVSKSCTKRGNIAKATASAKYYLNGDAIENLTKTVTLTCSSKGILS